MCGLIDRIAELLVPEHREVGPHDGFVLSGRPVLGHLMLIVAFLTTTSRPHQPRPVTRRRVLRRRGFRDWNSHSRTWLPKLDLVALGIHEPAELAVLGIVGLLQDVTSFVSKRRK